MKNTKLIFTTCLLILFLVITSCDFNVYAAWDNNSGNVQAKLKSICDPLVGENYPYYYNVNGNAKAGGCQAFVMSISEKLFGCNLWVNSSNYSQLSHQNNWSSFGTYIKATARPGDVIRVCKSGTSNVAHSVILYQIDGDEMTYYESEGKKTSNNVMRTTKTFSSFAYYFKSQGIDEYWVYQAKADAYNGVTGLPTKLIKIDSRLFGLLDVKGPCVFYAERYNDDPNHYAVFYVDDVPVSGHMNADSSGFFKYEFNPEGYSNGKHTLKIYYAYTNGGDTDEATFTINIPTDTTNPSVSDLKVENITSDGYDVSCLASDDSGTINRVEFPTWTVKDGQDDLVWHLAEYSDGRFMFHVSIGDHNNEAGTYITHVYAYDDAGNYSSGSTGEIIVPTWEEEHQGIVNFDSQGGNSIIPITVIKGTVIGTDRRPDNPTKEGFKFIGWVDSNGFEWDFDNNIVETSELTLFAKWEESSEANNNTEGLELCDGQDEEQNTQENDENGNAGSSAEGEESRNASEDNESGSSSINTDNGGDGSIASQSIPVTRIVISGVETIKVGESATLNVMIEPSNATEKSVTWTSSDISVLSVQSTGAETAVISGIKSGKVKLTAKAPSGKESYITVSVTSDIEKIEPASTSIKQLKKGKKRITVYWSAVSDVDGYEIEYSKYKYFYASKKKNIKGANHSKVNIKKLKSKNKYYVRIRTYKNVDGSKVYSQWSKIKNKKAM